MTIAFNARHLLDKLDGIGWYSYETIKRITEKHQEHKFILIFDRDFREIKKSFAKNVKLLKIPPPAKHPFLWYIWYEFSIPRILKKYKVDVFISPDGYISLRSKIKQIAVIHDINFYHFPKNLPFLTRKYYNYFFPRFAKKADRIVTVSNFSKNDIVSSYKINSDKIIVSYNGANEIYENINKKEQQKTKDFYTGGEDYFIFIGSLITRKNIDGMLKSFDKFKEKTKNKHKLVIIGNKMFRNKEIIKSLKRMKYRKSVVITGWLKVDEIKYLLGSAVSLLFVPFYEGFGIPIVEAMQSGTPIICSNTTATLEVAGDATILVNPNSTEQISRAMIEITENKELIRKLKERMQIRKNKFSWDKTADKLWEAVVFLMDSK